MTGTGHDRIPLYSSNEIIGKYDFRSKLDAYFSLLLEHNRKINLVSRETSPENLSRIAADCLIPFEYLDPPEGRFLDIGTGGGFPSLILLLAFPALEGLLIERTKKKARFLEEMVAHFGLTARIIADDFLSVAPSLPPESFDLVFTKLVRPDKKIIAGIDSSLKTDGLYIYYSRLDNSKNLIPESFSVNEQSYYLDDKKHLRHLTYFFKLY